MVWASLQYRFFGFFQSGTCGGARPIAHLSRSVNPPVILFYYIAWHSYDKILLDKLLALCDNACIN